MHDGYATQLDSNGYHPGWISGPPAAKVETSSHAIHPPLTAANHGDNDKAIQSNQSSYQSTVTRPKDYVNQVIPAIPVPAAPPTSKPAPFVHPDRQSMLNQHNSHATDVPKPASNGYQARPFQARPSIQSNSPNPDFQARPPNSRPPIQSDRPRPGPGEYGSRMIAQRLRATDAHSFYVKEAHPDLNGPKPEGPEAIAAIVYHRDANVSIPTSPERFEIWTRHNFPSITGQINDPLPFFHYSESEASRALWTRFHSSFYVYMGQYSIQSCEVIKGGSEEIRAFIEQREESKRKRPAEKWKAMLEEDWMKVVVTRCGDEIQRERRNPMEGAGDGIERHRSSSLGPQGGQAKNGW